jgi:phage anti-repressor protein
MNHERLDIIQLIKNNPIEKLSNDYQTRLLDRIKQKFDDSDQQMFVASFYCYLKYNPKTDFVIDMDNVWKWLGFSRKDPCKRVIEKHFIKDVDYKILLHNSVEQVKTNGGAGLNKEVILMNVETFKSLCLLANTDQSKTVRKYYYKLEQLLHALLEEESDELKRQLENKQKELQNTQKELTKEKTLRNKMLNRRCFNASEGEYVYIFQDNLNDPHSILKIGQTKNLVLREQYYSNINKSGGIVYYKKCIDCNLIEKLCHHILDKFRENKMQEWFRIDLDLAKKTIDTTIAFTDSRSNIESYIEKVNYCIDKDTKRENNNDTIDKTEEREKTLLKINFRGFIKDCCELDTTYFTAKEELTRAFRIYSKTTIEKDIRENLNTFLQSRFKSGVEFYENIRRNVWRGFRLLPLTFTVDDKDNVKDYERFILDCCKIDYLNKISYVDFFENFVKYKQQTNPHYVLDHKQKQVIQQYLMNKFANGRVHLSENTKAKHLFGILGLGLKNDSKEVLKKSNRTCKQISQIDSQTQMCINTWESLTIAAKQLNIARSTLSSLVRFQTVKNGYIFKYT